jgi:DNA-binding PadR family transcriptional regulator
MPRNNSFNEEQLTDAAYYILLSLLQPMHGYGIMQYVEELTGGEFVIGPATLYTILKKMQDAGYIALSGEDEDRKKTYCITEKGRGVIVKEVDRRLKMAEQGKKALDLLKEVLK